MSNSISFFLMALLLVKDSVKYQYDVIVNLFEQNERYYDEIKSYCLFLYYEFIKLKDLSSKLHTR